MQLPQAVPAPASDMTLLLNQLKHVLGSNLSPQTLINAVISAAEQTPWFAVADT